jgi:hypothetical protein
MPTNPLGADSCNVPINVDKAERLILGQLATSEDRSIGSLIRYLLLRGLEAEGYGDHAAQIAAIRQRRAAMIGLLVFLSAIIAPALGITKGISKDIRRASSVRTVRNPRRTDYDLELVEA